MKKRKVVGAFPFLMTLVSLLIIEILLAFLYNNMQVDLQQTLTLIVILIIPLSIAYVLVYLVIRKPDYQFYNSESENNETTLDRLQSHDTEIRIIRLEFTKGEFTLDDFAEATVQINRICILASIISLETEYQGELLDEEFLKSEFYKLDFAKDKRIPQGPKITRLSHESPLLIELLFIVSTYFTVQKLTGIIFRALEKFEDDAELIRFVISYIRSIQKFKEAQIDTIENYIKRAIKTLRDRGLPPTKTTIPNVQVDIEINDYLQKWKKEH